MRCKRESSVYVASVLTARCKLFNLTKVEKVLHV